MRSFDWNESTCDTLRDIVENYLETARGILVLEEDGTLPAEQALALRWGISDAEKILSDLGDPCDCCREGTYSHPDDTGDCLDCKHPDGRHEDYSGPVGSEADITS
jgi:hypothetical protein